MYKGAHGVKSNVVCDALILDEHSRSDTYPVMEIDDESASISHEATVSKVSDEQLFYLQSRGISEALGWRFRSWIQLLYQNRSKRE